MPSPAASVATRTWAVFAELALGVDARARRVAVADLHAAVDLGDREAPLAELAERPAVLAVASEVVERVLVLGEDEQLHLRVAEDALVREDLLQLRRASISISRCSRAAGLVDELVEPRDLLAEGGRVDRGDHVFELGDDLLLLVLGQVVEVVGQPAGRSAPGGTPPGRRGSSARLSRIRSRLRRTA